MNTYDPSDYIRYVTMDRTLEPSLGTGSGGGPEQRLPERLRERLTSDPPEESQCSTGNRRRP